MSSYSRSYYILPDSGTEKFVKKLFGEKDTEAVLQRLNRLTQDEAKLTAAQTRIEHGTDVSAHNVNESTPLHLASQGGHVDVARMFIERGADVSAQDRDRNTPLHWASHEGRMDVARMLIERGADVSARNGYESTPLHLASQGGHVDIARMFIERGAEPGRGRG